MAFAPWGSFTPSFGGLGLTTSDLGNWLRGHRKRAGLTQEELEDRSGVAQNYISRIERGEALNVSPDKIKELARGLGLSHKDTVEGIVYAAGLSLNEVALVAPTYRDELPSGRTIGIFEPDGTPIPLDEDTKKLLDLQAELLKSRSH